MERIALDKCSVSHLRAIQVIMQELLSFCDIFVTFQFVLGAIPEEP